MIFFDYLLNVGSPKISFKQPDSQTKLGVHCLSKEKNYYVRVWASQKERWSHRIWLKAHLSVCVIDWLELGNSVQFSSVQSFSCFRLCDPMNHSTPGLPVHHQLPEFTQTHVHQVSDAIQPSHPLLSPSPPAPNPSQHQGLFQWVNSSHEVAKVLEFQL